MLFVTTPGLSHTCLPGQEGGLDAVGRVGRHRLREAALEHQQLQQNKVPRQREPRLDRLDGGKSHMTSLNIFPLFGPPNPLSVRSLRFRQPQYGRNI